MELYIERSKPFLGCKKQIDAVQGRGVGVPQMEHSTKPSRRAIVTVSLSFLLYLA